MIREWQGLGYNRRAVNLHRAARHVAEHGWPDDLTELPGVGPYTAAAVACFAFGRDVLPVDVERRARPGAHRRELRRRVRAGALRPRRDGLPRAHPALRGLPARRRLPLARAALRAAAQAVALRGLVPAAARAASLRAVAAGEQPDDAEALVSLARDGLVVLRDGVASLPVG